MSLYDLVAMLGTCLVLRKYLSKGHDRYIRFDDHKKSRLKKWLSTSMVSIERTRWYHAK